VIICEINLDPDWSAWQGTKHMALDPGGVILNGGRARQLIVVHVIEPDFGA
jgi:hypothetical protein